VITSGLGTDRGVVRAGHRLTHLKPSRRTSV
jgi:hypothetical protein